MKLLTAIIATFLVANLAMAKAPTIRIDASTPAEGRLPLRVEAAEEGDLLSVVVRVGTDARGRRPRELDDLHEARLVVRDKSKLVLIALVGGNGTEILARFRINPGWLDQCDLVLTTGTGVAGPTYVIDLRAYLSPRVR